MDEQSLNQSSTTNGPPPKSPLPSDQGGNGHPSSSSSFQIPPSIASHPALANINWAALSDAQRRDLAFRLHEHTKLVKLQQAAANIKSFNPDQQVMIMRALQNQHQKMLLIQQQHLQSKRLSEMEEGNRMQKVGRSSSMVSASDQRDKPVRPPSFIQPSPSSLPPPPRLPLHVRPQQTIPTLIISFTDLQANLSAVPVFNPEMSEPEFLESLSKFVGILRLSLNSLPLVQNKPIPLHRLFMMVHQVNGFESVIHHQILTLF